MNDESYFGLKDDITPGNVGFYKKSVTSGGDYQLNKVNQSA